jgi:hypothetical protein
MIGYVRLSITLVWDMFTSMFIYEDDPSINCIYGIVGTYVTIAIDGQMIIAI